ncbi:hypothetical protein MHBO_000586 [Bonamia ostreae]
MLRTLRIAKGRGYRRILWLEDDAIFHKDFLSQFDRSMKKIPEDWSVVQFGSTFLKMSHIKKHDGYFTARKPIEGAFAVGIDERAFDDMIRLLELDMGVIDSKVISGACLKRRHHCYYILPFIVVADVRTSDINPRRIKYSPFSRIGKTRQRNSYENERYLVKMGDFYFPDDVCSISLILFIDPALDLQSVSSIMRWSVGQTYKMAEYIFLDFGLSASQKKAVTKFFDNSERFFVVDITEATEMGELYYRTGGKIVFATDGKDLANSEFVEDNIEILCTTIKRSERIKKRITFCDDKIKDFSIFDNTFKFARKQ